jgi:hypothetical protein
MYRNALGTDVLQQRKRTKARGDFFVFRCPTVSHTSRHELAEKCGQRTAARLQLWHFALVERLGWLC